MAGAAVADEAAEVRRAGTYFDTDDAPHCIGRVVAGGIQPGVDGVVRGVSGRAGEPAKAAGGAVCGFYDMAAGVVGGRGVRGRFAVLEGAVGGDTGAAGIAGGPAAAGGADV